MDPHDYSPTTGSPDALPKADIDSLLRSKRKAREHKACYPCRQRKVKCDLRHPCKTCVERDHPQLCDYHPPSKRHNIGLSDPVTTTAAAEDSTTPHSAIGTGTVTLSQLDFAHLCQKLESVESALDDLRREIRGGGTTFTSQRASHPSGPPTPTGSASIVLDVPRAELPINSSALPGFHERNDLTGQTVYIGGSSVPALVMALGRGSRERSALQEILGSSMLPLFGLDNETATYPFVDLWGLAHGWKEKAKQLAKTIPVDSQCLTFAHCYKSLGHVMYPGVADITAFEQDLNSFLHTRASYDDVSTAGNLPPGVTEQRLYDKDFNWIALLYAVLASGCQCSTLPRGERELTSQVYVCCSLECLRFTNFLSIPTLESVQALLVLGNVISNNMNAGTSWNLIGLTARLAQSLGLHQQDPPDAPHAHRILRSKIWWSLMWQDSLLSITYDRASFTALVDHSAMANPENHVGINSFHSSMLRCCKVGLDVVRDRSKAMTPREQFERITRNHEEIKTLIREAADHLQDPRKCRDQRDSLEYWALYLHSSYITSELCRPAISPSATSDGELTRHFRQTCVDSLINTVEAWLGLQNTTQYARHSWASVHRALSSALLLGIMGEHRRNERCRKHLSRFIGLMEDITEGVKPAELSVPMQRAIKALRNLRIDQAVPVTAMLSAPPAQQPYQRPSPPSHLPAKFHYEPPPQLYPPAAPRFIEDIALAGPSPRVTVLGPGTSSPLVRTDESPGQKAWGFGRQGSVAGQGQVQLPGQGPVAQGSHAGLKREEKNPHAVLNNILWGGEGQMDQG